MVIGLAIFQLDLPCLRVFESASRQPFHFIEALKVDSIIIALDYHRCSSIKGDQEFRLVSVSQSLFGNKLV